MKLLLKLRCEHAPGPHMNDTIHTLKSSFFIMFMNTDMSACSEVKSEMLLRFKM